MEWKQKRLKFVFSFQNLKNVGPGRKEVSNAFQKMTLRSIVDNEKYAENL